MEKIIWTIGNDRLEMIDLQRKINNSGSMKAACMLTFKALSMAVESGLSQGVGQTPSLIILDYETEQSDARYLETIRTSPQLAGVPLFFMCSEKDEDQEEECYQKGALAVLNKPITNGGILRMERAAWQYENTRQYERLLQKQATELKVAKEIQQLNKQLENRNQFLHRIFGKYFPDEVLEIILNTPEEHLIGGFRKNVAVLCSDLRGFSSIAEEMDSESMTAMLNAFFGKMTEIILKFNGIVIEFLGDGVLAVFGAMSEDDRYRENALAAAVSMQNAMEEVNELCSSKGYPLLEMGIGLQCGEAFVGNVGSEQMMRYNVLGSVVNECSRIESYSVGGQILVSKEMISGIEANVKLGNAMEIAAKGIRKPISIYQFLGISLDGGWMNLCNRSEDILHKVDDGVVLELSKINRKIIDSKTTTFRIESISAQEASLLGEKKDVEEFREYDNVAIRALSADGKMIFDNVYGKVMGIFDYGLKVRFTHINHEYKKYIRSSITT